MQEEQYDDFKKRILLFPLLYITILIAILFWRGSFRHIYALNGMPMTVPWFGALGGVTVSLEGIFIHNHKWKNRYDFWHMFSGIIGTIFGIFSYLFLIVIVKSTGATIDGSHNSLIFPLAAFVLGFSQQDFPKLLRRASSIIFGPGKEQGQKSTPPTKQESNQ